MSIYYSPTLLKLLADERLRELNREAFARWHEALQPNEPKRSVLSLFRRRQSPAACEC
jgi:hypothetical protein